MQCQHEGCQQAAVAHITEVGPAELGELHLCLAHFNVFFAENKRVVDQLRRSRTEVSQVAWLLKTLAEMDVTEVVEELRHQLLTNADKGIRWAAAVGLARIGKGDQEAALALRAALSDTDDEVREAALWALTQVERS